MPLKLNVGFNRKIGEVNYGSRGASVHLEIEWDESLAGAPERLKEQVRSLFGLAKASVEEELIGQNSGWGNGHAASDGSGSTNGNGRRRDNTRQATASQVRALRAIADRQQRDLPALLAERFGTVDPRRVDRTKSDAVSDVFVPQGVPSMVRVSEQSPVCRKAASFPARRVRVTEAASFPFNGGLLRVPGNE